MEVFSPFVIIIIATLVTFSYQKGTFSDAISIYRANVIRSKPTCLKVSNVSPELIDKALDLGDFAEDRDLKCFLKCYLEYIQVFDTDGKVVEENFKKHVGVSDEVLATQLYQKCGTVKGTDLCETAQGICKCVYQAAQSALKPS